MNLTKGQRRRLAREMRKLAMECITNGPEMANKWCGCAIGISMKRAGLWRGRRASESAWLAERIDDLVPDVRVEHRWWDSGVVSSAVVERVFKGNPTAVVFPLLALADAVEESEAPQAPEKSLP